ncbi:glycosyltransferase family 4 protein [Butyrivibrio sp. FCS006]|uniref:glycosyltransferase family 4 protein n=1 Tax=Butyrivibrio sp. FCS006 TaxID=1280684 RepID=UPI00040B0562|nr:glycosyltransferase family 1 protein [Butyrivibrio sp. FCS006]
MRVGVYFDDVTPEKGGASSILRTIEDELKKLKEKYDILICFNGGMKFPYKSVREGMTYINVDRMRYKSIPKMFFKNTVNGIRNMGLRLFYHAPRHFRESYMDYLAETEDIDIFWFTYPANVDLTTPFIYTIWDIGHRVMPAFPETTKPMYRWNGHEEQCERMLAKATFILTGNETGKGEILANYSVMENKIRIVPFPITFFCYGEEERPKFELPGKYFFYPAQFWPHKNHICIVKAVSYLRKEKNIDAHVILTGSDKGNKSYIQKMVKELGVEDLIHFAGFVSYEEMKFIYTHAAGTIFASLMGPNNIPPIEAVYLDCPLMITDIPGHVEQMGDGIMYFNGYKPNELAAHMEKLLTDASARDEALRRQLIKKKEFESYDYASGIISMLEEFELMRNTWKQ